MKIRNQILKNTIYSFFTFDPMAVSVSSNSMHDEELRLEQFV